MRAANAIRNALRPGYARVMAGKAWRRVRGGGRQRAAALAWARPRGTSIPEWCGRVDAALWAESHAFGVDLRARAKQLGEQLGVEIGGGGRVELLYFLTRLRRPRAVVETGVLHGFSSTAFLAALERNGDGGRLWSSDFPYVRRRDPERLVGVLVPAELRARWTLLLRGDRVNLPAILAEVPRIDLFHYDSDKTHAGRARAMQLVAPKLAPDAVVLMDDVQDNLFFREWVAAGDRPWRVFGVGSAFVGAVGVD